LDQFCEQNFEHDSLISAVGILQAELQLSRIAVEFRQGSEKSIKINTKDRVCLKFKNNEN